MVKPHHNHKDTVFRDAKMTPTGFQPFPSLAQNTHTMNANVVQSITCPNLQATALLQPPCCEHSQFKRTRTDCRAKRHVNMGGALLQNMPKTGRMCRKRTRDFATFAVYVTYVARKMHRRIVSPDKICEQRCPCKKNKQNTSGHARPWDLS